MCVFAAFSASPYLGTVFGGRKRHFHLNFFGRPVHLSEKQTDKGSVKFKPAAKNTAGLFFLFLRNILYCLFSPFFRLCRTLSTVFRRRKQRFHPDYSCHLSAEFRQKTKPAEKNTAGLNYINILLLRAYHFFKGGNLFAGHACILEEVFCVV